MKKRDNLAIRDIMFQSISLLFDLECIKLLL
jgi:hypothetical protein